MLKALRSVVHFYVEGFRNMTIGKTLWLIIGIKLFVMFAILRAFFFQPVLKGSEEDKVNHVATELSTSKY
ncbi:MAG: DUF4492 domain-containing protein [Bacteroidaceae bacterium]|nr:DUF4492 domain-containing protein [Bacteroidaceae bacterium]